MTVKEMYYYLYYKLYKFTKWSPSIFASDFNAVVLLNGLEIGLVASICFSIVVITGRYYSDGVFLAELIVPTIFIVIFNAIVFSKSNKELVVYIKAFDAWPRKKNNRGTFCVVAIVFFIVLLGLIFGYLSGKYNPLNSH